MKNDSSMDLVFVLGALIICSIRGEVVGEPEFMGSMEKITASVGQDVEFACPIKNLGSYRVAWISLEKKIILTIHTHVITRNPRIHIRHSNSTWYLQIDNVQHSDAGSFVCQINTDPMKSLEMGYLDIVESTTETTTIAPTTTAKILQHHRQENEVLTVIENQVGPASAKGLNSLKLPEDINSTEKSEQPNEGISFITNFFTNLYNYIAKLF